MKAVCVDVDGSSAPTVGAGVRVGRVRTLPPPPPGTPGMRTALPQAPIKIAIMIAMMKVFLVTLKISFVLLVVETTPRVVSMVNCIVELSKNCRDVYETSEVSKTSEVCLMPLRRITFNTRGKTVVYRV